MNPLLQRVVPGFLKAKVPEAPNGKNPSQEDFREVLGKHIYEEVGKDQDFFTESMKTLHLSGWQKVLRVGHWSGVGEKINNIRKSLKSPRNTILPLCALVCGVGILTTQQSELEVTKKYIDAALGDEQVALELRVFNDLERLYKNRRYTNNELYEYEQLQKCLSAITTEEWNALPRQELLRHLGKIYKSTTYKPTVLLLLDITAKTNAKELAPFLNVHLDSPIDWYYSSKDVKLKAIQVAGVLQDQKNFEALRNILEDKIGAINKTEEYTAAMKALVAIDPLESQKILEAIIRDDSYEKEVRFEAVKLLADVDTAVSIQKIEWFLSNGLLTEKQELSLVQILIDKNAQSSIPFLETQLSNMFLKSPVSFKILEALVSLNAQGSVSEISKFMLYSDMAGKGYSDFTIASIHAIVELNGTEAISDLEKLLLSKNSFQGEYIAVVAMQALVSLDAQSSIPKIIEQLNHSDEAVKVEAIKSLVALDAKGAISDLENLKERTSYEFVRDEAEKAIEALK